MTWVVTRRGRAALGPYTNEHEAAAVAEGGEVENVPDDPRSFTRPSDGSAIGARITLRRMRGWGHE